MRCYSWGRHQISGIPVPSCIPVYFWDQQQANVQNAATWWEEIICTLHRGQDAQTCKVATTTGSVGEILRNEYLAGNCGIIGTNNNQVRTDAGSLRLDVDTRGCDVEDCTDRVLQLSLAHNAG